MTKQDNLRECIFGTVDNIEKWQEVLKIFCEQTGASKGIVALRNWASAELVIPANVERELSSPMLYGFSEEEVGSYIEHYIQHDPWTEIEKLFHPSEPYALSSHIRQETLKSGQFWEWLEPQHIGDSVVLDIGASSSEWIAMNLYFSAEDKAIRDRVLKLATEMQSTMRWAWRLGQQQRMSMLEPEFLGFFLEQQSQAACLLTASGEVRLANDKAYRLFADSSFQVSNRNNKFFIENDALQSEFLDAMRALKTQADNRDPIELEVAGGEFVLSLVLVGKSEDELGTDAATRLVTIQKTDKNRPVWDNEGLTKRERQLVESIAKGSRIADFIRQNGISKSTGHFHWKNVKEKLKVTESKDIYAQHQVFLQNL